MPSLMEKQSNLSGTMENKDTSVCSERRAVDEKKGGIKTMPFILATELCENLAIKGFSKNMVNFFTDQFNMPKPKASNTVTNFNGASNLTPLLGAFIADSYAGKFWTITLATAIYLLGMIILTLSAALPKLRPPPCEDNQVCQQANGGQLALLYLSLIMAALGSGGIRPCVSAFGADQFVEEDPKQPKKTGVFFNWYYFALGVAILLAATVVVYIQDNVGWSLGLGIPTAAMGLSIIVFVIGYPLYRNLDPAGSPYTRLLQVIVAACRKRKIPLVSDPKLLYVSKELDAPIATVGLLHHTNQLKFFDKAAILTEDDSIISSAKPNLWRLNTVHRVEELKSILRVLPITAAGILFATASIQQSTFSVLQAKTMNRHLTKSFQIPSASMSVFTTISLLVTIVFYDRLLVSMVRRYRGIDRGINFLQRMAIGLFISILATLVAGFIEVKRRHAAIAHGIINSPKATIPISVFWIVPQYSLHGIAEAFLVVGHLEFLYSQAPESMRSTGIALFWAASGAGDYISTLLVTIMHKYTDWIADKNLNKGKLEYFYWLLTILQVINFVYYLICAKFYTLKPVQGYKIEHEGDQHDERIELVSHI